MNELAPGIYLDHAATSWPKSPGVCRAVAEALAGDAGAAGRGTHRAAQLAGGVVAGCRRRAAELIGAESPACIALAANGTMALNMALHGMLAAGDHVVTTAVEHNSVLRPLHAIRCAVDVVPCDAAGRVDGEEILRRVDSRTRMVVLSHASNVTGTIQEVAAVGRPLKARGVPLLCDAAQSLGDVPVDVGQLGVGLLAAPGHKGLGGPLGTGLLYVAPELHERIAAWMQGGTGTESDRLEMPSRMPGKLEAGNLNVPAIAGLDAALAEIADVGVERIGEEIAARTALLVAGLRGLPDVEVIGHRDSEPAVGVVSFRVADWPPQDVAAVLDAEFAVRCRAGLHCAPLIHAHLGSAPEGTVRMSVGRTTTADEVEQAVRAVAKLLGEPAVR